MTGNLFLDALPSSTQARLLPQLEQRTLNRGQVLSRPGEPFREVFFPIHSVISTVTLTAAGSAVEVGLAGREGLSPLAIAFGSLTSPHSSVVQIPDDGLRMDARAFLGEVEADPHLRERCRNYAEYTYVAATQFAACNGVHPVEERYARWILMANDRTGTNEFSLTQEYSAQMLGVRRATVTNIALKLAKQNLIEYKHGHMAVTDRRGLEDAACECYDVVNAEFGRLMGYGITV